MATIIRQKRGMTAQASQSHEPTASDNQCPATVRTFAELFQAERSFLSGAGDGSVTIGNPIDDLEPWVTYAPEDRVGLALSGGGIRSATFNLGLLQGLAGLRILEHVDYLSTVSGGGYIGGWLTSWQRRRAAEHTSRAKSQRFADFPGVGTGTDTNLAEPREIQHLRQFSRFLSPRVGFFEVEIWYGIVSILCGLIIGLLSANSVLAICFLAWISVAILVWHVGIGVSLVAFMAATLAVSLGCELWWQWQKADAQTLAARRQAAGRSRGDWLRWTAALVLPTAFSGGAWWSSWRSDALHRPADVSFASLLGAGPVSDFPMAAWAFGPALAWIAAAVCLLILRFLMSTWHGAQDQSRMRFAGDRAVARLLALAAMWSALVLLWGIGSRLHWLSTVHVAGGALTSSGLFALLRNWFVQNLSKPQAPGLVDRLKPLLPQLLGYVAVVLGALFVASIVMAGLNRWGGWFVFAPIGIIVTILWCFDPAVVGLHAFYRDRIARAFLGEPDAVAEPRKSDDFELQELFDLKQKPLHLICTAANGLADDRLGSLSRCARSTVLSAFGISIGNCWAQRSGIRLGSALTASAAAFNSNMGSVSTRLGPAVTFVMMALNMRLGLWVSHPCSVKDKPRLPGWLFFREMFGMTRCRGTCPPSCLTATAKACQSESRPKRAFLHLSDGGHFENLAIYELIRRHCRFIIVSDCGADPDVKFDDLGNAVRRVREDFGVDIEIDLEPLKPGAQGWSVQHIVVGTIHYDRENDKGILLYIKPTLNGDEPSDVAQYKARNQAFPHESTGDQFYDEAQWESYRRLGEHVAWEAFGFVERLPAFEQQPRQIFTAARQAWYPMPADLPQQFSLMSQRLVELERAIRSCALPHFACEMFPELHALEQGAAALMPTKPEEMASIFSLLQQMMDFMEEVIVGCHLETHSAHPLNVGWSNLFQRWVQMPSFEAWWPVLQALYGPALRYFVEERLRIPTRLEHGKKLHVYALTERQLNDPGLAFAFWQKIHGKVKEGRRFFGCDVELSVAGRRERVQVAVVPVQTKEGVAGWSSDELLITPGLWGTTIGHGFLRSLLDRLFHEPPPCRECVVDLESLGGSDRAKRDLRTDLIEFYTAAGFRLNAGGNQLSHPGNGSPMT